MGPWLGVLADVPGVLVGVLEEVAAVRADVLGLAAPPVDANATPATPPPSPAATTAVITSRRIRPESDAPIRLLLPFGAPGARARRRTAGSACALGRQPARQFRRPAEFGLSGGSQPSRRLGRGGLTAGRRDCVALLSLSGLSSDSNATQCAKPWADGQPGRWAFARMGTRTGTAGRSRWQPRRLHRLRCALAAMYHEPRPPDGPSVGRARHVDRLLLAVDEPIGFSRRLVTQHRARPGTEDNGPEHGFPPELA